VTPARGAEETAQHCGQTESEGEIQQTLALVQRPRGTLPAGQESRRRSLPVKRVVGFLLISQGAKMKRAGRRVVLAREVEM
jgi:hypothetical protein